MDQQAKYEKAKAIVEAVTNTTQLICNEVKKLPKTGKAKRNIFLKTYNRRPLNKKKMKAVELRIKQLTYFGAINLHRIRSTPIPKFPPGTIPHPGGMAIVGESEKEIIKMPE